MILFKIIFILAAVYQLDALKTKVTQLSPVMDLQQVILADILSRWFYTSYWLRGLCFARLNETKEKAHSFIEKYWRVTISLLFLCRFKTFPCAAVEVKNEPVLGFKEGSKERSDLEKVKHTHHTHWLRCPDTLKLRIWLTVSVLLCSSGITKPEGKDRRDSMCDWKWRSVD